MFVWYGSALATYRDCAAVRATCLEFAGRLTSGRFPLPEIRVVNEVRIYTLPGAFLKCLIYPVIGAGVVLCAMEWRAVFVRLQTHPSLSWSFCTHLT